MIMNNNVTTRIKKEDRSALGKFLLILVAALILGGTLGFLTGIIKGTTGDMIKSGVRDFITLISPYALITITLIATLSIIVLYQKCRKIFQNWDGESEDDLNRIDTLLSFALWFSYLNMILIYFFFAVGIGVDSLQNMQGDLELVRFALLFFGFILSLVIITIEQQHIINFQKEINPEKRGSVFDMRFAKKWQGSCDEAEKLTIYKCAYKSYQSVGFTCVLLWIFCIIGSFIWNFGLMPVTIVTIIWVVQVSTYCLEAIHLNKHPSEIHK